MGMTTAGVEQSGLFPITPHEADDLDWAKRAAHWLVYEPKRGVRGQDRDKRREPLILSGHGARLHVEHGALVVQNGFTHYPQKREVSRLFPGDRTLPTRIVILDASGSLSFDVLSWLSEQDIPLVQINWQGEVVTVGRQPPADKVLYEAQLAARENGVGFALAQQLVREKILGSAETLRHIQPTAAGARAEKQLGQALKNLDRRAAKTMEDLRLLEGRAALAYFRALQSVPLRWWGIGRRPIPQSWECVPARNSGRTGTSQHAMHPFNAMLNYAYGVLESQVRIATIAAGLDPTIGYLHANQPGRVALVYDLMEPQRPVVDRMLLGFIAENKLMPKDFTVQTDGVCRLHPQLAAVITKLVSGQAERVGVRGLGKREGWVPSPERRTRARRAQVRL